MKRFLVLSAVAICATASAAMADDAASHIRLEPAPGGGCTGIHANVNLRNLSPTRAVVANICYHENGVEKVLPNVFIAPRQVRAVLRCEFGDAYICGAQYHTGHQVRRKRGRK